jgi:serine protease AprX
MVKNKYILSFLLFIPLFSFAESNLKKFIVYFKDKPSNIQIESLFSAKAMEKRKLYQLPFDYRDYPVDNSYIEQLKQQGMKVLTVSNWLNAAVVETSAHLKSLKKKPFISDVVLIPNTHGSSIAHVQHIETCEEIQDFEDGYVNSFAQFHMLNGEYLHEQGFNGEDMTIAICDAGFQNANVNPAFSALFSENRVLGTYDYVNGDSTVFEPTVHYHGSNCLSFIAGKKDNQYLGASSRSDFYLFQTEYEPTERLQEEFNLATALERCAQLGVDVVSISLGYLDVFDVPSENHDTSDLRKNNTPAARAVNIAASKGMLVVVAAGNEGAHPWRYITTPADADSAFAIGAVDINGVVASFSSYGLPNETRVKPNVAAIGKGAYYINSTGNVVGGGNGTSYATPVIAGFSACLWQAFPSKSAWEIKTAVEQSASQYLTPDDRIGYGIPDFKKAYSILAAPSFVSDAQLEKDFLIYPNPFHQTILINNLGNTTIQSVQIYNQLGQMVYSQDTPASMSLELGAFPDGMYLIQITTAKGILLKKLIKD